MPAALKVKMMNWLRRHLRQVCFLAVISALAAGTIAGAKEPAKTSSSAKKSGAHAQDDSTNRSPAKDLLLRPEGQRKAEALSHFVEGTSFEESGEMEKALEAYLKVL